MIKYMIKRIVSSAVSTCTVKRGGIKNTSQIKALIAAEIKTGKISNVIASNETVSKRINATTLYPSDADKQKQIPEIITTVVKLYRYCFCLVDLYKENSFIHYQM